MLFQILDSNNQVVEPEVLNREACEIWNKPVSEHKYATPHPAQETDKSGIGETEGVNWVDSLELRIARGYDTWDKLKQSFGEMLTDTPKSKKDISYINKHLKKPYLKLIEAWEKKGYVPAPILLGTSSPDSELDF